MSTEGIIVCLYCSKINVNFLNTKLRMQITSNQTMDNGFAKPTCKAAQSENLEPLL